MPHALSQKQLAERLDFVGLDNQQRETLSAISPVISGALGGGLDAFYSKARTHPETARFFANEAHLQHAKGRQAEHWKSIASAKFDAQYVDAVSAIGRTHARLGLEPRWYIGGYALLVESILRAVIDHALGGVLHRRKSKPLGDQVASVVKALRSIGSQVQAIHDHMASIASSAREQAAGIAEINATVGNMDLITQQNAAMVEQTSAAIHKLSAESATLLSLVRAFKISSHRAVAPGGVQRMSVSRVPAIDAKLDERPIGVSNSARQGMR